MGRELAADTHLAKLNAMIAAIQAISVGGNTGTYTDKSGTIAAGGTKQTLAAQNGTRKSITIQNPSTEIESLFINFTSDAATTGNSIELTPGALFTTVSTELVSVLAATTGHKWVAKELN